MSSASKDDVLASASTTGLWGTPYNRVQCPSFDGLFCVLQPSLFLVSHLACISFIIKYIHTSKSDCDKVYRSFQHIAEGFFILFIILFLFFKGQFFLAQGRKEWLDPKKGHEKHVWCWLLKWSFFAICFHLAPQVPSPSSARLNLFFPARQWKFGLEIWEQSHEARHCSILKLYFYSYFP